MKRATIILFLGACAGLLGVLSQNACGGSAPLQLCGEIPSGGCPAGRGGTCDDKTCEGLYDCVSGAWKLVEGCAANATTSSSSSSTGAGGSGTCGPVIDHSKATTGCKPDLETPDCPADAATSCAACDGCEDFFLCETDTTAQMKGWVAVAYCNADGEVVLSTP